MKYNIETLHDNHTWDVVKLPEGNTPIGVQMDLQGEIQVNRRNRLVYGKTSCKRIQSTRRN